VIFMVFEYELFFQYEQSKLEKYGKGKKYLSIFENFLRRKFLPAIYWREKEGKNLLF